VGEVCHAGARFEALDAPMFMLPTDFIELFYIPRLPSGTIEYALVKQNVKSKVES